MTDINLDGLRMNAVDTDDSGVSDADTLFEFHQEGANVWATYAGGSVARGYLVGIVRGAELEFRYCQMEADGALDGGHSNCVLKRNRDGLVQIVEFFEWASRPGSGTNVIQELRDEAGG